MAIANFFYDQCIPFNAVNSVYFQSMFDAAFSVGAGYRVPSYHALRSNLLRDSKKEVQLLVDSYRKSWSDSGCTIMADGWTDIRQRTLINFLVYCPRGIFFMKSVDASSIVKDAQNLFKLFDEVVEWVGATNIVHMVTDNAANYVAAGRLLCEKYPSINWSPCAAHCLNLILKDIGKMDVVADLAKRASKVSIFVYNHIFLLNWLRTRPGWTEILRPGATRFATTFITLRSLHDHKHDLQALVTSKDFRDSRYSKDRKGINVVSIILDNKFWNDCLLIVKVVAPLLRLLRIVDSDEKPSMGYVYEGMYRARLGIKNLFNHKKRLYKPYTQIIKQRWDKQLRQNIHAAAYWLNPAFQYDQVNFCEKVEVMAGVLDMIEKKGTCKQEKMIAETKLFRDRLESFSRDIALSTSRTTQPDEWWRIFGYSAPNLQKLAIRILSQTSSSSGCERNWSVFQRVHEKRRNKLEHQRLCDLVYVHYNLRLKNRLYNAKKNYDPIDYESIDKTDFWIVDEDEEPELDNEELDRMLYEEGFTPRINDGGFEEMEVQEEPIDIESFDGVINVDDTLVHN